MFDGEETREIQGNAWIWFCISKYIHVPAEKLLPHSSSEVEELKVNFRGSFAKELL